MAGLEAEPRGNEGKPLHIVEWMDFVPREHLEVAHRELRDDPSFRVEDILQTHEPDEDYFIRLYLLQFASLQLKSRVDEILNEDRTFRTRRERRNIIISGAETDIELQGGPVLSEKSIIFGRAGGTSQAHYRKIMPLIIDRANEMLAEVKREPVPPLPNR